MKWLTLRINDMLRGAVSKYGSMAGKNVPTIKTNKKQRVLLTNKGLEKINGAMLIVRPAWT